MKNSDRKFQLLSTVIITFFICILLLNSNYKSVESQTSTTFLTLTGSNYKDVDNSERLQLKEFTLSTWFKTDKQDYLEPGTIVNKGGMNDDTPGNNMNYGIWITPEELLQGGFETETGANIFVNSKQKFNDGNWHNVILSNDGSFLRLYVDGVEIAKTSTLGAIPDITGLQSIRIGANSLDLDKFFSGDIDEVILWDHALSSDEIFNFYNYDEIPLNGRIIYLPFSSISPTQTAYKYQPFKTFDGTEKDEIDEEESFRLTNFSLGTWFRADRIDHEGVEILLNKGGFVSELNDENLNFGIWLNPSETIEGGFETKSGTNVFVSSQGKYNDGLWHYVLLTYDGKVLRLYIDGVLADSKITSGVTPDNNGDQEFVIGGDSSIDERFLKGDLDEIRVWNRALGTEEISNGFKNNIFNTNGQIFYESYSDSDSDMQQPIETPDTQTPPGNETEIPLPPIETPDTQTPPGNETEIPLPPIETPDTQTPPGNETEIPSPPIETPDTQTPPGNETEIPSPPIETPDTQTPPGNETEIPSPPIETPDTQTPPGNETEIPSPPIETPDTQTPPLPSPPIETPDTQTPPLPSPPIETPDTQTPPSIDTPTGFLLLKTNVINDNNGTKQASNFTIKILGTQASPSSFKAAQSPLAQIVEIGQGEYSTQVVGIEGYDTKLKNECTGFTILNNITVCTITLNDLSPNTPPPPTCPPGQRPAASQHLNQTTQQCVPDPESPPIDNATGFLILRTDVINDNGNTRQASDFTIKILGTQASPSSLKAAQSPLAQVIALKQGKYYVQIVGIEGYDTKFKHECAGFTILNSTKVCTITLNDLPTTTPSPPPPPPPPPGQNPVAKLVAPSQVQSGTTNVVLDASGSSNYDTITINQISGPTVTLNDIDVTKKQFTAPNTKTDIQLVFQAVAKKGDKTSTAEATVLVSLTSVPPSPPPPPTGDSFVPFNFAALGDWGCNSNTDKNVQSMLSKDSELVLGLGDYSYESDADCWLETISPINDRMNITIGNHDSDEEEGPEITVQLLDHFNLDKQYYSYTKGNVFFLVMSTQTSYSENSEQFNFVQQELDKASKDPNIDWIVVSYHKPIYATSAKHTGLTSFRDIYHPLFDQYNVDLVLSGHNHNYQRTFPLQFNEADSDIPIIVNKNPNTYNEAGSPIFITAGTGGVGLYSLGAQPEFNAKQFGKFGHINVNVSRDTSNKLIGTFYDISGNKLDEFTITKAQSVSPPLSSSASTTIKATSQTDNNPVVDKFGVKQIYPTKPGGEEWFMNMDNIKADPRFEMKGNIQDIKKNIDGSWSPIPGDKVRLIAYTSDSKGKFDENDMSTYNLKELAAKGHWYKENDWKNIEMGGYFKLNNADDLGMGYSFSTRSIDDSSTHGGCGGATPKFNIGFDGEIKAKKEMWHISLVDSPGVNDEDLSSIVGKWLGIKGVIYNLPGDKGVKQEFWIDKTNDGKWEKIYEFTDQGGFGERGNSGPEKCGGTWDQLYTWGSPKSVFRWDQSDVSFKFLSVREILPPTQ